MGLAYGKQPENSVKQGRSFIKGAWESIVFGSGAVNSCTLAGHNGKSGTALTSKEVKGVMFHFELKLVGRLSPQYDS